MKRKSITMISSLLLITAMLAACNTETEESLNSEANTQQQTENEQNNETDTNTDSSTIEKPEEETTEQTQPVTKDEPKQETLTYISNEKQFTEDVITSTSKELGYSIKHLENYTLESEEPGVDHLFYNEDNTFSMQIRVNNNVDASFDNVKTSTTETIAAIAPEGKYTELDLTAVKEQYGDIKNIVGYEALIDTEEVVMVTFERDSKIVTLTIYDTPKADLTDAFLQMGLTIK